MAISSQHKGKRGELVVFAELVRRGAEVYVPLVDTGIDAIVYKQDGTCLELQVKATQADDQDRYFNFYWEPRPNRLFICVSLKDEPPTIWVLPWDVFKEHAQEYARESERYWHLPLPQKRQGDPSGKTREQLLEAYCVTKREAAWEPLLPPQA